MSLAKRNLVLQVLLALALLPGFVSAQTVIAHRGLFHDTALGNELPENTTQSVLRAFNLGLGGAELDTRLSSDGTIMITHDVISNRTTINDNFGGALNPVEVAEGIQASVAPVAISSQTSSFWTGETLKAYGTGARLINNEPYAMSTLTSTLGALTSAGVFSGTSTFKIILDIQDPTIFSKAASIVTQEGLEGNVFLKFFASKALFNNLTYNGSDTCYQYMENNNLNDSRLQIIPQINDGELDIDENDNAGISVWGTTLTVPQYLDCWATARTQHADVAFMPIVSASVPEDNTGATNGAQAAFSWANANQRNTMSIVPNPDAGSTSNSGCTVYSFQSNAVPAKPFNLGARTSKANLVANNALNYVIYDVMGDLATNSYTVDYNTYVQDLCNGG